MTFRTGWYDAPMRTNVHPEGTRVARPKTPSCCWGCVGDVAAGGVVRARGCALRARNGRLTCSSHREREQEAQELRKAEEATAELVRTVPEPGRVQLTAATSAPGVRRREVAP